MARIKGTGYLSTFERPKTSLLFPAAELTAQRLKESALFPVVLDGRTGRNETRGWVVDPFFSEIGKHGKAGFLRPKVAWRRQNSSVDHTGLHPRKNFWLPTHLENFYLTIGRQAGFLQKSPQADIRRGAVARNPQGFAFQVFLRFDRWLNEKIERGNVDHASNDHDVAAGKIDVDDIATG